MIRNRIMMSLSRTSIPDSSLYPRWIYIEGMVFRGTRGGSTILAYPRHSTKHHHT